MGLLLSQGGLECEPRWWRGWVWLGVAIMWNCVGFKVAPSFYYGVQVVDGATVLLSQPLEPKDQLMTGVANS